MVAYLGDWREDRGGDSDLWLDMSVGDVNLLAVRVWVDSTWYIFNQLISIDAGGQVVYAAELQPSLDVAQLVAPARPLDGDAVPNQAMVQRLALERTLAVVESWAAQLRARLELTNG